MVDQNIKYQSLFLKYFIWSQYKQENIDLKLFANSGKKLYRLIGGSNVNTLKFTLKRSTDL
jgi:hypothetical protein